MNNKVHFLAIVGLLTLALVSCTPAPSPTPTSIPPTPTEEVVETTEATAQDVIVLGDISNDPDKSIRRAQPLADYLAANLADFGISSGTVKVAPDMDTMIEWMQNGEVDLYFDSVYPVMTISDATNAQPILRRWRDGVGEYHTVFFTLAGGDIQSLEDLQGHSVGFDEPFSTSGYMMPLTYIINAGLAATEYDSTDATVADDEIGYVFSGDDDNTIQWVLSERIAAGVTDDDTFADLPEETRTELTVIAETDPLPRQVVLAREGLDAELVAELIRLMSAMDESEEGAAVLDEFDTSQFDEFPEGIEEGIAAMRAMYEAVQGQ